MPANQPSTEEMRVSKSPFEIILLDDIGSLLHQILEIEQARIPEGLIDSLQVPIISTDFDMIEVPKPWFSFSIVNDGPGNVEFCVNSVRRRPTIINAGESDRFDFGKALVEYLYLRLTAAGTATVRLNGVY